LRFSRVFFRSSRFFFSWKKKNIKQICSSYCQLWWSRGHTKVIIFEICPNFPTFLCNCQDFFSENLSKTQTNKTKKELRIAIVRILSYSWVHTKKHFQFSPNYFNLVFPDFSPIVQIFFSIDNIQLSYFHPGANRTKKKKWINQICRSYRQLWSRIHTKILIFAVCPNFSNFLCNCPDFFSWKLFHDYNEQNKKKTIMHIHHN
jgi:hypothetical protein